MIVDVDPKVDYAFKYVFGRESNRPILIHLIDSVLHPAPGHHIEDIELLNPFNPKESLDDKLCILDLKARDQTGRQFNVEMQILPFRYYEKRILYYGCKLHQQQLHVGEDYLELRPTISISFLDHVLFDQVPDYHLRFRLWEESHRLRLTEDLEFHLLELPKFEKSGVELASELDIWLYFLRHAEKMDTDALPAGFREQPVVLRALEELTVLTQTDIERERYEARRKALLDHNTGLKVARMEGRQEGRQLGEKIGLIHLAERLLNRVETPSEQLALLSPEELSRLADDLQAQVLRKSP